MKDLSKRVQQISKMIDQGFHTPAAIQCVTLIEFAMRELLQRQTRHLDGKDRLQVNKVELEVGKGERCLEDFTMGELLAVIRNSKFFAAWSRATGQSLGSIEMIKLRKVVNLRNRLIHNSEDASRTDAELLFSALRVFIETFGILALEDSGSEMPKTPKSTKNEQIVEVPDGYVLIPPGTFMMGSPPDEEGRFHNETQHEVTITRPFLMKSTPVTQAEWESLMRNNPSKFRGSERPVERVSWFDAIAFCNALSRKEGLEEAYILTDLKGRPGEEGHSANVAWKGLDCLGYRLPTEAEWEYACRAGTTRARYGALDDIAWYGKNSDETHDVGTREPNAWGLYDMLGNVWEWCQDWYEEDLGSSPVTDPCGPAVSLGQVNRGSSCFDHTGDDRDARAAGRNQDDVGDRHGDLGLRVARTSPLSITPSSLSTPSSPSCLL